MKTTVILEDDVYKLLVSMFGKKGISKAINKTVVEHLVKEKQPKSMFGALKELASIDRKELRDHYDRY